MRDFFLQIKKRYFLGKERGFTILELIFVIIIFAILTSISIFNFGTFSARISFDNLTQDIALRIVQAQKDAMMGAVNSNFISRDVKPAYGAYFTSSTSTTIQVGNQQFIYFTDTPNFGYSSSSLLGDKVYIPNISNSLCGTSDSECISATTITTGEYVSNICYVNSGTLYCTSPDLSIVFVRPYPDATLSVRASLGSTTYTQVPAACIEIASPYAGTAKKTIRINSFGQISTFDTPASSTTCS